MINIMKISKYHLIKTLLSDRSLDRIETLEDASDQLYIYFKIFKKEIPEALLRGIEAKKNVYMTYVCNSYIEDFKQNESQNKSKYDVWLERQIQTNKQYKKKQTAEEKADLVRLQNEQGAEQGAEQATEQGALNRLHNEQYINMMLPQWQKMQEIIKSRETSNF